VAQAFQPVQAQAKACGYQKLPFERNSVLEPGLTFYYNIILEGKST
jgi:hypothetical protein